MPAQTSVTSIVPICFLTSGTSRRSVRAPQLRGGGGTHIAIQGNTRGALFALTAKVAGFATTLRSSDDWDFTQRVLPVQISRAELSQSSKLTDTCIGCQICIRAAAVAARTSQRHRFDKHSRRTTPPYRRRRRSMTRDCASRALLDVVGFPGGEEHGAPGRAVRHRRAAVVRDEAPSTEGAVLRARNLK